MNNKTAMGNTTFQTSCACWHARRASRLLSQLYDDFLRPSGLRSSQYGMLRCIESMPNLYISEIGRTLDMDQTTVTRNISKLEKAGLVQSAAPQNDPRKKIIALSQKGRKKLLEAQPLWEAAQEQLEATIGNDAYAVFLKTMQNFAESLKK